MKNVSGCPSVNVLAYVLSSERAPSNSSAGRPFTPFERDVAAETESNEVRSRPLPLRSAHLVTGDPSAYASCPASNHIWRPAVTGGALPAATTTVAAESAVVLPAVLLAVTAMRSVEATSALVRT